MPPIKWLAGVALGLALLPQAALALDKLPASLATLEPDHFAARARVQDDRLEPHVIISTQGAHKARHSTRGATAVQAHLRALVDRNSGAVSYEVWHDMTTDGAPLDLTRAHYRAGGQLAQTDLAFSNQWLENCQPLETGSSCTQRLRVAFALPEAVVKEIAAHYAADSRAAWPLRLKDRNGQDLNLGLAPAEAAGLIRAVDQWRATQQG